MGTVARAMSSTPTAPENYNASRPGLRSKILALALWGLVPIFWAGSVVYLRPVRAYFGRTAGGFSSALDGLLAIQGLATVGVIIILRAANRRFGWLILATAFLSTLNGFTENYSFYGLLVAPEADLPLVPLAAWVQNLWVVNLSLLFIYVPLFFPDGTLPSPRWRPVFRFITLYLSLFVLVLAFADLPLTNLFLEAETPVPNPFGIISTDFIPPPVASAIFITGVLLYPASILAAAGSLVSRWRDAGREVRQQIKWLLYILGLLAVSRAAEWLVGGLISWQGVGYTLQEYLRDGQQLLLLGMVAALGFALLKYRLYDIDLIINRTLVYGALTAVIVATYVFLVAGVGALLPLEDNLLFSLAATGVVAVLFNPLRVRLQRVANRLMFGRRDDPYAVLSELGRLLSGSAAPEATLQTVVETVATALKLPYVAIQLEQESVYRTRAEHNSATEYNSTTEHGSEAEHGQGGDGDPAAAGRITLPLVHQNEVVGRLVVAPRAPGEALTPKDRKLLEDIANQAGAVAHAVRLTVALRRSREMLVLAREEERRRIRRDLHDELGPSLASQTFKLDAALDLLLNDPQAAAHLLNSLKKQNQRLVTDIRRLVYELRPPALDELGLSGTLAAHAAQISRSRALKIDVVTKPDPLPPLPAAVEVAAYRIALEGITNVVRHAQANTCTVALTADDSRLTIGVSDDGVGLPPETRPGVGLASMRERAEEVGGTFEIAARRSGGTRVTAVLPAGGSYTRSVRAVSARAESARVAPDDLSPVTGNLHGGPHG